MLANLSKTGCPNKLGPNVTKFMTCMGGLFQGSPVKDCLWNYVKQGQICLQTVGVTVVCLVLNKDMVSEEGPPTSCEAWWWKHYGLGPLKAGQLAVID